MDLKPKGLLKRMFDFALNEIDRRSRPPERLSSTPSAPFKEPEAEQRVQAASSERNEPRARNEPVDADLPLEVTRAASGAVLVRWSVNELDLSFARPLAAAEASLAVRLVSFTPDAHAHVRREVLDVPAETLSGYLTLQRPEHERIVVSVGLLGGDQFVSIVHAQLD